MGSAPPAGVLRSMFRAEHPYERADHLADSLARSAVAVRRVFSQLPLSRVEGRVCVAVSVVRRIAGSLPASSNSSRAQAWAQAWAVAWAVA